MQCHNFRSVLKLDKDLSNKIVNFLVKYGFKVRLSHSKKNCFICFNESPLEMMKNAFYFILKAFFVLEIFKFLS